jgi:hypothetical protein
MPCRRRRGKRPLKKSPGRRRPRRRRRHSLKRAGGDTLWIRARPGARVRGGGTGRELQRAHAVTRGGGR